jgi:hypothetical protein
VGSERAAASWKSKPPLVGLIRCLAVLHCSDVMVLFILLNVLCHAFEKFPNTFEAFGYGFETLRAVVLFLIARACPVVVFVVVVFVVVSVFRFLSFDFSARWISLLF